MSSTPDWFGLLKWSLAHNDGTTSSDAKAMNKEEADWLERVMREAVKDEPTRMKEIMVYLTKIVDSGVDDDEDQTVEQLEELRDIVEGIDMAEVFTKFGGVQCLLPIITGEFPVILQSMCCSVIATLAQNNPKVQEAIYCQGTIGRLVRIFISTKSIQLASKVSWCSIYSSIFSSNVFLHRFCMRYHLLFVEILRQRRKSLPYILKLFYPRQ